MLLPHLKLDVLTYILPKDIQVEIGDFVIIPFRNQEIIGVLWRKDSSYNEINKIKSIIAKIDLPPIDNIILNFINWVAIYNITGKGSILKMLMPIKSVFKPDILAKYREKKDNVINYSQPQLDYSLSEEQAEIVTKLIKNIKSRSNKAILINGVTGSGKTEVYFTLIEYILKEEGGQVLIIVPEISLTNQLINRIEHRFGFSPSKWHSDLTEKTKRNNWLDIIYGKSKLIIGARSALFLPYNNLKLIIVDEEHDSSFKQEDSTIYNARDMAVVRANMANIPIILSSATPSLETVYNVKAGKYIEMQLTARYGKAVLPDINLIDMRTQANNKKHFLSDKLITEIKKALSENKQTILFLNRRGYAPLTICSKCGYRIMCKNCTSWLVLHKSIDKYNCHHCGYSRKAMNQCPDCNEIDSFIPCGPGVERIEEEVKIAFPEARVLITTKDTMKNTKITEEYITSILHKEVDIIIGTQIIAKGHNFPDIVLIGVIDADLGLLGGDLRAAERTYQLLQQVSGRAGRFDDKGRVFLQTYNPDNIVINALISGDKDNFIEQELLNRKIIEMPPYFKLACIILSGKNDKFIQNFANNLVKIVDKPHNIEIFGPIPAMMHKLKNKYRYRILVKANRQINIQKYINNWLSLVNLPSSIQLKVDIDPYNFI